VSQADQFPAGITSWEHMPYPYRRWNGAVWCQAWVDDYNRQLDRVKWAYDGKLSSVDEEVEAWYRMLTQFDLMEKQDRDETLAAGRPLPERYSQA
jgi:hypothetical protein